MILILKKIKNFFIKNTAPKEYCKFIKDGGDKIIYKNIFLKKDSVIIDCGGFDGEFTDQILKKKFKKIYIYEPDLNYYNKLTKKYSHKANIKVLNLALHTQNKKIILSNNLNASSIMEKSVNGSQVKAVCVKDEFKKYNKIDLLKLNIEGAEYGVLDLIFRYNIDNKINSFLIQFHKEYDESEIKRNKILRHLSKKYKTVFSYKYIWELYKK
jgi:FkbM family methyltransferase